MSCLSRSTSFECIIKRAFCGLNNTFWTISRDNDCQILFLT